MNTTTRTESTALQTIETQQPAQITLPTTSASLIMSGDGMERLFRFAEMMAQGAATVPKHLQGKPADCLAVAMQATQWGMNPFAVAQKTHLVNGTLGYEAQLVNAVLQATGAIDGDFSYEFKGTGDSTECRVGAVPAGKSEIVWGEWYSASKVTTKNSPLWKTNIRQQMGYLQVKNWARAYKPAALLGVYTTDELIDNPPRNMGAAEVVVPEVNQALLADGKEAAERGVAAYQKFWADIGAEKRKALAGEHPKLKQWAIDADKARTTDTPVIDPADNPEAGVASGEVTLESVLAKINAAKNEDALNVAADWANALASDADKKTAGDRYDARLAEMRGA